MAKKMATTTEAIELLRARGIEAPYQTVVRWVRGGLFKGARQEDTARGPVWMIPAASIESFEPPKRGRTPKAGRKGGRK